MEDVIVPIPANAQEDAKLENKISRQTDSRQKQLHWTIIKWTTTIILSCAMLVLLVSTKLTFLGLSRYLNTTNSTLEDQVHYETTRILIYFTITAPYWLFLVRAVLMVALTQNNCWPTKSGIFWCVAIGTLEPAGIVIFTFCVLPFTDSLTCLYIMSASISFPVVRVLIQIVRGRFTNSYTNQRFLSAAIILSGLAWLTVHVLKMTFTSSSDHLVVLAAVSILLVNLAHIPYSCLHVSTHLNYTGDARRFWKRKEANSTWKSSLIVYFVKSLSTLVASAVVYFIQNTLHLHIQ
ncbi:uncharacterized protein LOC131937620 [Physella acuta]|uniref:uncharacterized protein LOC131937620 n=1 Tax=Physella acuta TaxID=109671 RepID=UPI0027DB1A0A|nr:uncharacterized protein LOC131937620 [Physella acuta]XP_059151160.1 uncharacterized protein LOC131937620 [Physella acuta]